MCFGSGFGCATPLLAGVLGCVCVCVRAPVVPRRSWLGFAVWLCVLVLGLGFRLRPATPGWGVRVCVCLCARSACTPPILARVRGVCVCAWARFSAAPRHSWVRCWGVCVFLCALCLYPATPGWGVRCACVCFGSGLAAPRHSWLGCWGMCVFVCALRSYPATPGWGVRRGYVCLGSGFGCAPPLLAGVLGCVCWCAPSACTPPFLAGSCGVWVGCCLAPVLVMWFVEGCAPLPRFAAPACRCCLAPVCVPCLYQAAFLSGVPRGPALLGCASSGPVVLSAPVGFPDAVVPFRNQACASGFTWQLRGARGGRARTGLFVPAAGRCCGSSTGLASRRTRLGPHDGDVPGGCLRRRSWAACAAVVCVC